MFLLRCLRCRWETAVSDDTHPPARCRRCGGALDPRRAEVIDDPREVRRRVLRTLVPLADGMLAYGLCQAVISLFAALISFRKAVAAFTPDDLFTVVGGLGLGVIGGLIAVGGWMVRRGRVWQFGLVASGLTLLSPFVVGVPLGAWGLWKLTRPDVKAVFVIR